ncbi:hypothetical protein GCM10009759_76450 [Kitasatospora saccharophila]|uniref:Uncharacterized protein n=1 Tax=Kitasatospora saccharophila TaxID=407973 RepID=A0ABN2YBL3_9ACTN
MNSPPAAAPVVFPGPQLWHSVVFPRVTPLSGTCRVRVPPPNGDGGAGTQAVARRTTMRLPSTFTGMPAADKASRAPGGAHARIMLAGTARSGETCCPAQSRRLRSDAASRIPPGTTQGVAMLK